nr:protransforming growth factor alpha-like [Nerophis lumbriciformis]
MTKSNIRKLQGWARVLLMEALSMDGGRPVEEIPGLARDGREQNHLPRKFSLIQNESRQQEDLMTKNSTQFVAAAVRSHFDNCPDSHRHFCFHGTCRYLILEETPACICHPGFVGMRCEHADLLAVVATKNRQQTVATVLVLCVIGCVVIIVVCALLK